MKLQRDQSGQALMEFAFALPMLCIFMLGVVDYGRAVYDSEVIMNLAGEGSGIASRTPESTLQLTLQDAANTVMADTDINVGNGCVIISAVTKASSGSGYSITGQAQPNSPSCTISVTSKVGSNGGAATIPLGAQTMLNSASSGYTIYVTEVFYKFSYATPVGSFLHGTGVLPSDMYAAAYY